MHFILISLTLYENMIHINGEWSDIIMKKWITSLKHICLYWMEYTGHMLPKRVQGKRSKHI